MQKHFQNKIIQFIKEHELISQGDHVLVAFSGGPDSVFLLSMLNSLKSQLKIELAAAHVNHNLRGAESDDDLEFSAGFCNETGIAFYSASVDVKTFAKEGSLSIEEAARILRYEQLSKLADEIGANKIATAHNLNDNAETVLLNLFKGKGLKAVAGIPIRRGNVVRPILNIKKDEILGYLKDKSIPFRTDLSNFSDIYQRNALRNKIIPLVKELINPQAEEAIFRYSQILSSGLDTLNEINSELLHTYVRLNDSSVEINLKMAEDHGIALTIELIKHILLNEFNKEFRFSDKRHIISLINGQKGKRVGLSDGIEIIRERNSLTITKKQEDSYFEKSFTLGESVKTPLGSLHTLSVSKDEAEITNDANVEFIEADNLDDSFTVRTWKHGDRFSPLGMNGNQKVSDFLTNSKIPNKDRARQLVLLNKEKIVWVVGLRLDDRYKIKNNTKRVVKLWLN